ncbi:hypothetical protein ANCDUO_11980 [Ancylostoma duodenale]|uniref:Uncharacterized protein n=1 Tax=Ancylostoma duodenale TaxID=51022 RepID=A0A0C2CMI9_9BILA|nr:hypothetical protein ANCDUO_11980 [Ancylostoma duodenale]
MLNTSRSDPEERNERMEEQFNRHNNAQSKKFRPGDVVWVRDYRKDQAKWVYGETHRRHANQLCPRTAEDTEHMLYWISLTCQRSAKDIPPKPFRAPCRLQVQP